VKSIENSGWPAEDLLEYSPGHKLHLTIGESNEFSHLARLERFKPLDPSEVYGLEVQGELHLKSLRLIAKYKDLRVLMVGASMAIESEKGAAELAKLKQLEYLHLTERGNPVYGDEKLVDALLGMKKLRYLSVPADRMTDAGLDKLSKHASLEELEIRGMGTSLTGAALRSLAKLPKLRYLVIHCTKEVADADLDGFANCKELQTLGVITTARLDKAEQVNAEIPSAAFFVEPPKRDN